jgi:hypothetical protein
VSQGAQKNFLAFSTYASAEWDKNPEQFNEEFYKRVVVKAMLFRRTEELVSAQTWYQGGYRANIVAYTLAKFANLIQFGGIGQLFDFKATWNRQTLSQATERQLTLIAEHMFGIIVAPEGGFQNVTEWCKKEICWQRARDLQIPLLEELGQELIGRDEDKFIKKDAESQQTITTSIQIQAMVVELGPAYWRKLQVWGRQGGLISPGDDSILSVAGAMPRKLPTEKQCARLAQIKRRLEEEGYPAAS